MFSNSGHVLMDVTTDSRWREKDVTNLSTKKEDRMLCGPLEDGHTWD